MTDAFAGAADAVHAPATRAAAVTPSDTDPLPEVPKALWVGTGGTLVLRGAGGGPDASLKVGSGALVPVRAAYVRAAGTTAADIVALY